MEMQVETNIWKIIYYMHRKLHVQSTVVNAEGQAQLESRRQVHGHLLWYWETENFKGSISKIKTKNHIKQNQNQQEHKQNFKGIQRLEQGNKNGLNQNEGSEEGSPIEELTMSLGNQANYDQIQTWRGSQVIRREKWTQPQEMTITRNMYLRIIHNNNEN